MSEPAYDTKRVSLIFTEDGSKIVLKTPYNAEFIKEIKEVDERRYNPSDKSWSIPTSEYDKAEKLLSKYFPAPGVSKKSYYYVYSDWTRKAPSVDGVDLISFDRHHIKPRGSDNVTVLRSNLESGGSRQYPTWRGEAFFSYSGRESPQLSGGKFIKLSKDKMDRWLKGVRTPYQLILQKEKKERERFWEEETRKAEEEKKKAKEIQEQQAREQIEKRQADKGEEKSVSFNPQIAKVMKSRSNRAVSQDAKRQARRVFNSRDATGVGRWARHPSRYDIEGVDTLGVIHKHKK